MNVAWILEQIQRVPPAMLPALIYALAVALAMLARRA